MSPLERAARALKDHLVCGTIRRGEYKDAVRVVLEAIREPSEVMVRAGDNAGDHQTYAIVGSTDDAAFSIDGSRAVWQAMIDAALEEK